MFKPKQLGFTLIELMTTVAVLAIVMSIALPSFRVFTANTQIRSVTESIRNGLQIARASGVKHNANVRFTLSSNTSWTVGCVTVTASCPAVIQSNPSKEGSATAITLAITGASTLDFTSLGTLTPAAGQMSRVNVDNSSITPAQSKDLSILIGAGGNTRACDPNVSTAGDSRNCVGN